MKEFKRSFVLIISLSICAVLLMVGAIYYLYGENHAVLADRFVQDKEALSRLMQNSSEIHRLWIEGEDSREWGLFKKSCLKQYGITNSFDESLLRCNPLLLECNVLFTKKLNYHFKKHSGQKSYRYLTKSNTSHVSLPHSGYLFTIRDNQSGKHLDLLLTDQCQEVYLQNRVYAYGEEVLGKVAEDFRFDNFNQNIYLDRHLVTNAEINEWIDFGNSVFTKGLMKKEGNQLFLPAIHLSKSQMENFCSFKGKQLMLAHYFDAATFLPMDLNEVMPLKNNRSPYYWTKKKSEFKPDCHFFYAQECLKLNPFHLNSTDPTWAGIMDSMGGVFEAFRNPIDPESNLKASSFYFPFNSPWHKLGFRAGWDGEGGELRHFDFKSIAPDVMPEKFEVGFRCMRESK